MIISLKKSVPPFTQFFWNFIPPSEREGGNYACVTSMMKMIEQPSGNTWPKPWRNKVAQFYKTKQRFITFL